MFLFSLIVDLFCWLFHVHFMHSPEFTYSIQKMKYLPLASTVCGSEFIITILAYISVHCLDAISKRILPVKIPI